MAVPVMGNDSPTSLKFSEKVKAALSDPNLVLEAMYGGWEDTNNPYYAWNARPRPQPTNGWQEPTRLDIHASSKQAANGDR
jgi:hypothetical protein